MKTAINKNTNQASSSHWSYVCDKMRAEFGEATYKSWLSHLILDEVSGSEIKLKAPTRFIKEWIASNYSNKILATWKEFDQNVKTISITVKKGLKKRDTSAGGVLAKNDRKTATITNLDRSEELSSPLDNRFTFDNFVVDKSNKLAFASSKAVAENKKILQGSNPLFLYGGVGVGKTHLMHAIALSIRENTPERKVVYLSAEKFMYQFIRSLRENSVISFKENFRSVDVFMIDDVQFICGKESTQEEFFHTVNALMDMKKQVVISGDRSPADLDGLKERVRSRLGGGLVVDISTSDFDLRLGVLRSKIKQINGVDVPEQVLEFIAGKIRSNIRELEGALNKVIAHATLMGEVVTLGNTKSILSDLLRANDKSLTISEIQKKVVRHFGIKLSDMSSAKRARNIARPRQLAMYLCKTMTSRSLSEIGRKFGGKDHTTVMHAVKRVDELRKNDEEFSSDINEIIASLS